MAVSIAFTAPWLRSGFDTITIPLSLSALFVVYRYVLVSSQSTELIP